MKSQIPIKVKRISARAENTLKGLDARTGVKLSDLNRSVNGFEESFIPLHASISEFKKSQGQGSQPKEKKIRPAIIVQNEKRKTLLLNQFLDRNKSYTQKLEAKIER